MMSCYLVLRRCGSPTSGDPSNIRLGEAEYCIGCTKEACGQPEQIEVGGLRVGRTHTAALASPVH